MPLCFRWRNEKGGAKAGRGSLRVGRKQRTTGGVVCLAVSARVEKLRLILVLWRSMAMRVSELTYHQTGTDFDPGKIMAPAFCDKAASPFTA